MENVVIKIRTSEGVIEFGPHLDGYAFLEIDQRIPFRQPACAYTFLDRKQVIELRDELNKFIGDDENGSN